jgi:hypothetical protein
MRRFVLCASAAVCAIVTFGPWLRSGSSRRSSYEVLRAAEDLDVLHGWVQPAAATLWYFVPLLAALVVLASVTDRPLLAAGLLGVTGLAVAFFALRLTSGPFSTDWGATAGSAGGLLAVGAAAEAVIHERRSRARTRATELGP